MNARPLDTENMDVETGLDQSSAFATSYRYAPHNDVSANDGSHKRR